MQDLHAFFAPIHFIETEEESYYPFQWGKTIAVATEKNFGFSDADIVIVGCGESRGNANYGFYSAAPDAIRNQFYQLYNWHTEIKICDLGNLLQGATMDDTKAALRTVLAEIQAAGKIAILLGGSHDLTMQQYEGFSKNEKIANLVMVDQLIDIDEVVEVVNDKNYLMPMITAQPNFIRHYTHFAFQSYQVSPHTIEVLDKLHFELFRLGKMRENIEDCEPIFRSADIFSMDINAVRFADAPANILGSPNGLTGDEACTLSRYAGMAALLTSYGIYGYLPENDTHEMTAKLIAQMLWYFIDGIKVRQTEARINEAASFLEFHVTFSNNDTVFYKSKKTGRWWMRLPNKTKVPCSHNDYLMACKNEIPERWLKEQEKAI